MISSRRTSGKSRGGIGSASGAIRSSAANAAALVRQSLSLAWRISNAASGRCGGLRVAPDVYHHSPTRAAARSPKNVNRCAVDAFMGPPRELLPGPRVEEDMSPSRSPARWLIHWTLLVAVAFTASIRAHNGEIMPLPPRPPHMTKPGPPAEPGAFRYSMIEIKPERWSWLHWWEANRDAYLEPLRQRSSLQPLDPATMEAIRADAIATLRRQLSSNAEDERAAAALALGHIGAASLNELSRIAADDVAEAARLHAIVGIGVLGGEECEQSLSTIEYPSPLLRRAALAALGLLEAPGDTTLRGMMELADGSEPAEAVIAAWAVGQHINEHTRQLPLAIVTRSQDPWLVSEGLLGLGQIGDDESLRLLLDVLAGGDRPLRLPVWRKLIELDRAKRQLAQAAMRKAAVTAEARRKFEKDKAAWQEQLATLERDWPQLWEQYRSDYSRSWERYRSAWRAYRSRNPNAPIRPPFKPRPPSQEAPELAEVMRPEAPQRGESTRLDVVIGEELIFAAKLRAAAAIALGRSDRREAVAGLVDVLREPPTPYNELPKGFAIMSLGQIGMKESLPVLLDVLGPADRRNREAMESPLRGYAALALGLYARPYSTPQGLTDRPAFDKALLRLAERLADPQETVEVRSACAVALGLARRTSGLRPLSLVGDKLSVREQLIGGYTLLGRGMLADHNILVPAQQLLLRTEDQPDMEGILARRAAVLGLGLCGADEAVPVLTEAWHLNYYVNREVIIALALHGSTGVGRMIIERIRESRDPQERAYLAAVLGELLARERPGRLTLLIRGTNYTFREEPRIPLQRLANGFLFDYLLPAFGEEWR